MEEQPQTQLDRIWPAVQAEIESARRRETIRRRVPRIASVLVLCLLGAGAAWYCNRRPGTPSSCPCRPWEFRDVTPIVGACHKYPLISGKNVYVVRGAGRKQHVACLNKHSGELAWESDLTFSTCRLTADDRRLYILAKHHGQTWTCTALHAKDGRPLWSRTDETTPGTAPSIPTLLQDGLCWSVDRNLVCRDRESGDLRWQVSLNTRGCLSSPIENEQTVFVASVNELYALEPADGTVLWTCRFSHSSAGGRFLRPILAGGPGRIVVAAGKARGPGGLWCVATDTRELLWRRDIHVPSRLQMEKEHVLVRSGGLYAFNAVTGSVMWSALVDGCGFVSFADDRIYAVAGEDRARLVTFNRRSGGEIGNLPVMASCNGIVVSGGMGFMSGNDGRLRAIPLPGSTGSADVGSVDDLFFQGFRHVASCEEREGTLDAKSSKCDVTRGHGYHGT